QKDCRRRHRPEFKRRDQSIPSHTEKHQCTMLPVAFLTHQEPDALEEHTVLNLKLVINQRLPFRVIEIAACEDLLAKMKCTKISCRIVRQQVQRQSLLGFTYTPYTQSLNPG